MTDMDDFVERIDAAAGPLKRLAAITAQVELSLIPADAGCSCLCCIYEPHTCDGFRAEGCIRTVPGKKIFGMQLPPTEVPVCQSCMNVNLRMS